ncbi:MAG TPA: hypothetical protein VFW96_23000 [Thermomicrobiales bacterium]|nr:hypothetical protein [Thermomicrobiales bacterium]
MSIARAACHVAVLGCAALLWGCGQPGVAGAGVTAAPAATVAPVGSPVPVATATRAGSPAPAASAAPVASASPGAVAPGYLEGRAAIGPLQPVERVGVPTPTPPPAVCTARSLAIDAADGRTPVTTVRLQPDCTYRVALPPGTYVVRLAQQPGIGGSKDLPKTVTIASGQTTRLDIAIDTGIR